MDDNSKVISDFKKNCSTTSAYVPTYVNCTSK